MFLASKLLLFVIEPLFWVLVLLFSGLLLLQRRPRAGRRMCWLALAVLLVSGWTSGPEVLVRDLESRYPATDVDLRRFAGVVVLGGALSSARVFEAHGEVGLNNQAERMTEAVALMRRYPHLQLLFTGGSGRLDGAGPSEALRARIFFDAMGVDLTRAVFEDASRNTYENAEYSARLGGIDRTQPWLLLTSAYHLPRAMGVFIKNGWNVTAWPVDYRMTPHDSWFDYSLHYGPRLWSMALHEWLGYWVYRMTDRL